MNLVFAVSSSTSGKMGGQPYSLTWHGPTGRVRQRLTGVGLVVVAKGASQWRIRGAWAEGCLALQLVGARGDRHSCAVEPEGEEHVEAFQLLIPRREFACRRGKHGR